MKILLLGATGRTGKYVLKKAIEKGYQVNCLVRYPERVKTKSDKLNIFKGTPANVTDLKSAMKDCDTIISVLNISRTRDFPWSPLRTPPTLLSDTIQNIIQISTTHHIKRIIVCSAWGVAETSKHIPFWFRWLIQLSNIKVAYQDHEKQENLLQNSSLNWTIIRPTGLTNSNKENQILESHHNVPSPNLTINRKSVAKFMVDALIMDRLIHQKPVISTS